MSVRWRTSLEMSLLSVAWLAPVAAQQPAKKSLAEWVTQLGSKDHGPRQQAYNELRRDRSPRIVALLGKQIESFGTNSQSMACNLLQSFTFADAREVYKQLLSAKDPYLRVASAARYLRDAGKKDASRKRALPTLVGALTECPVGRRLQVMYACRQVVDEPVLAQMRKWLGPKQPTHIVTGVLRELLGREKGVSVATVAAARLLLASPEPRVQGAAMAYLSREDAGHEQPLAELSKKDPAVFWAVRDLLPTDRLHSDTIVSVIVSALLAPRSDRDVAQLAQLLKAHSETQLAGALRQLIGHDKDDIRSAALKQLATLRGGLQTKDLKELLRSDAVVARLIAADTMRRRDDTSGLQVVLAVVPKAKKHKAEAARVLGRFRSRLAMPLLLTMLDDADANVRSAAWDGVQRTMRSLFPYRRFDFRQTGYSPRAEGRAQGIAMLRSWWRGAK